MVTSLALVIAPLALPPLAQANVTRAADEAVEQLRNNNDAKPAPVV